MTEPKGTTTRPVITFDLFSALLDSRTGGATAFQRLADDRGWQVTGTALYDGWDRRNKEAQRRCGEWVRYTDLAASALAETYASAGLEADAEHDIVDVLASLPDWPLWPDVVGAIPALRRRHRLGLLSNVDDALFARTRAHPLLDTEVALTSERLRVYKPDARIYHRARDELGVMVHVATSARDVRGALEAGIPVVRLRRPGHELDSAGPTPDHEAANMGELPTLVGDLLARR